MSDLPFDQEHVDKYVAEEREKNRMPVIFTSEELQNLQAECHFQDKNAMRLNINKVPIDVLEFIHRLPDFTSFETEALGWKVEINKKPIKKMKAGVKKDEH